MSVRHFADRMAETVLKRRSHVVVGLDPRPDQLPLPWRVRAAAGGDEDAALAVEGFCFEVLEAVAEVAAGVKVQSAFFELLGWRGVRSAQRLLERARELGLITIFDGKRGDIGPTAEAYARAHLATPPSADAVTVNPYLGWDGVGPFLEVAATYGKGVFVLLKTSNPSAGDLQDLPIGPDGGPLWQRLARRLGSWGQELKGARGYSLAGAVVGATYPEAIRQVRSLLPEVPLLIPGVGAQGGQPDQLPPETFGADGLGALVASSRAVLYAYRSDAWRAGGGSELRFAEAARWAAADLREKVLARAATVWEEAGDAVARR